MNGPPGRPLIGITTYCEQAQWGSWDLPAMLIPRNYCDQVAAAGGIPILLPSIAQCADGLEGLDGLILSGGPDVEPIRYGEQPAPNTTAVRPERDAAELDMLSRVLATGLPLLAICRGMQLLNVAFGGTLVQHLPDIVGHDGHCPKLGQMATHDVRIASEGQLAEILGGAARMPVPTHHHQGIGRLGTGLVATAWADDGTIEALELLPPDAPEAVGHPFGLAVQWHPEADPDLRLFLALVAAARRHRGGDRVRPSIYQVPGEVLGSWIGPYRIEEKVGWGGFSHVYRTHGPDGTSVLLKVAMPHGGSISRTFAVDVLPARGLWFNTGSNAYVTVGTDRVTDIFRSEAQALRLAAGRRLPKLIDELATPFGLPVLVLQELADRWSPNSAPIEDFARLLEACADLGADLSATRPAMGAFGGAALSGHGDLKPEHIFLDANGDFVFIDPAYVSDDFLLCTATPEYHPWPGIGFSSADVSAVAVMIYQRYAGQLPPLSRSRLSWGRPEEAQLRLSEVCDVPAAVGSWVDAVLGVGRPMEWHGSPARPEWVGDQAQAAAQLRAAAAQG